MLKLHYIILRLWLGPHLSFLNQSYNCVVVLSFFGLTVSTVNETVLLLRSSINKGGGGQKEK
jgi:hypothetical protein